MSHADIGSPSDVWAIGDGTVISQLKRNRKRAETQYDLPPMWGTSRLRDESSITDSSGSAQITEDAGEIKLETGANGSDRVELRTAQYAQYRAGLYGDASMQIRPESLPTGNQVMRWGYFDDNSGFGWGLDSTGIFTFFREGGSDTIYRPSDDATSDSAKWQVDDLDGQDDSNNPSGINLDPLDGHVFHIIFRAYGGGIVRWAVEARDDTGSTPMVRPVEVDRRKYDGKINIVDFNRQLRVELDNNTTGTARILYIGARQFSLLGDTATFERRTVTPIVRGLQVTSNDTYVPVLAVRKKSNFPTTESRGNSVRTRIAQMAARSNGDGEVTLTVDANVTNSDSDWTDPERWDTEETAIEVIDDTVTSITQDDVGQQVSHIWLSGSNNSQDVIERTAQFDLGAAIEAIVWARTASSNTTFDVSLAVEEQW